MAIKQGGVANHAAQAEIHPLQTEIRTFAELAEAFHNADDAYLDAVTGGIMNRQAEIDARAAALVAFLTGPRPATATDARSIVFAAMQAVVDGGEFDPAWRNNVSAALVLLGARGAEHSPPTGKAIATDFHVRCYPKYLQVLAALAARPDDMPDDAFDAMSQEADDIFTDLMEGCATSFTGVMLKARAAHHWTMLYAQGSVMSPRTFADMFGIMAADLEVLTAGGKAVQS
jgi:hypothetical protein